MKISALPENDTTNGWSRMLLPRTPHDALEGDINADWLVIGGGYAGLAAARRLAENRPHEKIVLVEAGACGENTSGRNSGFAIDIPHNTSSNLDELEGAHGHMRLARRAVEYLEQQVNTHGINCDWSRTGKYQAAVTPEGSKAMLEPFAAELEKLNETHEWVEADQLAKALGTNHFHRAVYTPGCILMNPAALTRGLADTLPDNVSLFENTPVTSVDYQNGVSVETPNGSVRAPRMILAANGFSKHFGFLRGKLFHIAAHASLTRPLTEEEQKAYGVAKPWGLTPANAFGGITMRYTNDHRILIRQQMRIAPDQRASDAERAKVGANHKKLFDARFPQLPNVTMENTWTGFLCMSLNSAPAFGPLASNVWAAACQNGIGVTKGTISGMLTADLACERENPLIADMQKLGTPVNLPPWPLTDIGARVKLGWEVWKNRHEA